MDDARLEPWRRFFSSVDVFSALAHAILIAATDSPQEFRRRRDSIVEQIFRAPIPVITAVGEAPGVTNNRVSPAQNGGNDVATRSCKRAGPWPDDAEPLGGDDDQREMAATERLATASGYDEMGLDWLDKLVDEMDEATLETEEVLRLKAILLNHQEHSVGLLFESLRRLQLMRLTVDKLKSTEIEAAVAALRKHKSDEIRKLVRDIAKGWKVESDEWIAATKVTMEGGSKKTLDKPIPSAPEDEEGLAIPRMDVDALFMSQAIAIPPVDEFLHGIDDDGRIMTSCTTIMDKDGGSAGSKRKCEAPRPSDGRVAAGTQPIIVQALPRIQGSLSKKRIPKNRRRGIENDLAQQQQGLEQLERRPSQRNPTTMHNNNVDEADVDKTQAALPTRQEAVSPATNHEKPQEPRCGPRIIIRYRPASTHGEPRSLCKRSPEKIPHEDAKPRQKTRDDTATGNPSTSAKMRMSAPLEGPKQVGLGKEKVHSAEADTLERTKSMLREAYQEAENAKRKRTIQVMEPHELPRPMGRRPVKRSSRQ